ncbi:MAG: hypothetical protein IPN34_19885 [Planctomycetes bacterium]|nr:hypothetical protein [Planctomycetota bacterium]
MNAPLAFLFLLGAPVVVPQDPVAPPPVTPEQRLQAKLAEPFLRQVDWCMDFDVARQRAAEAGKLVFGYFTTDGY